MRKAGVQVEYDLAFSSDIEHIRARPTMYIGALDVNALLRLALQLPVENPNWGNVRLKVGGDYSVTMYFDQPDLCSVRKEEVESHSTSLIEILNKAEHAIAIRAQPYYSCYGGPRVLRSMIWVALSTDARIELEIDNVVYNQNFSNGYPTTDIRKSSRVPGHWHSIFCYPDRTIVERVDVDVEAIVDWYGSLRGKRPDSLIIDERNDASHTLVGSKA